VAAIPVIAVMVRLLRAVTRMITGTWRRSLQLRVVTITLVMSSLLVAAFGFLVAQRITAGLVVEKREAALEQLRLGREHAIQQLATMSGVTDPELDRTVASIVSDLSSSSGPADAFDVVLVANEPGVQIPPKALPNSDAYQWVPPELIEVVHGDQALAYQFIRANTDGNGRRPYLVVGAPVQLEWGQVELYYLLPLDAESEAAALVRNTVLVTGTALVLLLALVAGIVTRLVVTPVRLAARTAERLAAGLLHERMTVRGEDDLARLAGAFNVMATNLQQQIVRLEELSRLQRRFTSDVSHELRTPLTTVRMAAEVLYAGRDDFRPEVARSAELLYDELDRFESLLTDLLEISRFDAGFANLEAETVDLIPILHRVVGGLKPLADRLGVRLEVVVPDTPVVAEVDTRRVERILRNLLGNAIEHGEHRPVRMTLAADESSVAITVRDYGVGLKPGEERLVFNRFWRADPSRARQTGGTGLGLSISQEDARLHGGWLEAWGAPGRGAQFRLTLPIEAGGRLVSSPLPLVPEDADAPLPEAGMAEPVHTGTQEPVAAEAQEPENPEPESEEVSTDLQASALGGIRSSGGSGGRSPGGSGIARREAGGRHE